MGRVCENCEEPEVRGSGYPGVRTGDLFGQLRCGER